MHIKMVSDILCRLRKLYLVIHIYVQHTHYIYIAHIYAIKMNTERGHEYLKGQGGHMGEFVGDMI